MVPSRLAKICQKAISRDPARGQAESASALAADLEAFLEHRLTSTDARYAVLLRIRLAVARMQRTSIAMAAVTLAALLCASVAIGKSGFAGRAHRRPASERVALDHGHDGRLAQAISPIP